MSKQFEAGQQVYSEHGERAEYVTASGDGHIVRPILECCDDESGGTYDHAGQPVVWRHVFHQEPVAKFSDELKALHDQIAAAKAERDQLRREDSQRQRERAEKLKRFAILDNLEAFIDGKITHYLLRDSSYTPPKVVGVAQALSNESSNYRETLRLLTLGGNLRNGEVNWILNQYSDGSGSHTAVVPCTSYEQAADLRKQAVADHFAHRSTGHERQEWIDAAGELGIEVPEAYRRAVAKARITSIESNLPHTRRQADQYAEYVTKAEAELAQLRALVEAPAGAA